MMNTPYEFEKTAPMAEDDWARARLAGTRMLIAEESFDAILQMLIETGFNAGVVAIMLDRLSTKLMAHATGRSETRWALCEPELVDQATRLSTRASVLRLNVGGRS